MANFDQAAEVVSQFGASGTSLSNSDALELYGWFKQATVGDTNTDRPGIFDQKGRAKWDSWDSRRGASQDDARGNYVATAKRVLPAEWSARIA
jgi:diazepam-binding inhibitor (GABA receptor modulating acyl-CoA-binding protein)